MPSGAAWGPNNRLYVADTGNHRIQTLNSQGQPMGMWGSRGTNPGQFENPSGIAVDRRTGNVFVADTGNHRIQKFDATGILLAQWGSYGCDPGQFYAPTAVTVDDQGDVYVLDNNDRVQVFRCANCPSLPPSNLYFPLVMKNHPTWQIGAAHNRAIKSLVVNGQSPDVVYAGTGARGLWRKLGCGAAWEQIPSFTERGVFALASPSNGYLYAAFYGDGVYLSMDHGQSWQRADAGLASPYVYALVPAPNDPLVIYAAADRVYKTVNGGGQWIAKENGLTSREINCLAIIPDSPQTILAGTCDQGVGRSTDGGETWHKSNAGLNDLVVWSLAISPADSRVVFAGTNGGVFRSEDRGQTWSALGLGKTWFLAVHPQDRQTVYAGTDGDGVYISRNMGSSWLPYNEGLGNLVVQTIAIDPWNCHRVYVGTNQGIWERPTR